MKTIWVVQYRDGTADVFDSEQGAPALPYIDAYEVQERIAELEAQLVDANKTIKALSRNASILDVSKKPF